MKLVESSFSIITRQAIRRASFTSVRQATDAWNDRCVPFVWTKTADEILAVTNRKTNDLDFFISHADVEADTFARLTVETKHQECRIDLAVDARMRPVDQDPQVALMSLTELAADPRAG